MAENAPLTENEQKKIDRAVRSAEKAQAKAEKRETKSAAVPAPSGSGYTARVGTRATDGMNTDRASTSLSSRDARAVGHMINEASDAAAEAVVRQTTKDAISGRLAELGTDPASVGALTETVYRAYEAEREGRRPSKADVSAITHDGNALTALNELREWRNRNADIAWISAAQETAEQAMDELSRKARAAAGADGGITDSYTADAPAGRFAARTSAGEAVEVDRITETGKGEIRVGLTDGTDGVISSEFGVRSSGSRTGDIFFDNEEDARLFSAAATLGGAAEANAFIAAYAPGQDIDAYAKAYRREYAAGLLGRERTGSDVLTQEQAEAAYGSGAQRRASGNVDAVKVEGIIRDTAIKTGVTALTEGGMDALPKFDREALRIANDQFKAHGISVVLVDTAGAYTDANGNIRSAGNGMHVAGTNIIFITKDNVNGGIMSAIGHETWHYVVDQITRSGDEDAKEYIRKATAELLDVLRGLDGYDFDARRKRLRQLNEAAGKQLTEAELDEEQVANGMWDIFTNDAAVKEIEKRDRNLFERIRDALAEIVGRIKDTVARYGVTEARVLAQSQEALDRFNKVANEAVRMADEARRNAEFGMRNAELNAESNAELSDEESGQEAVGAGADRPSDGEESAGRFMVRESVKTKDGTTYKNVVLLDSDVLKGTNKHNRNEVFANYVRKHFDGVSIPVYNDDEDIEIISFARKNERVLKDGAKNKHKVLDKLATKKRPIEMAVVLNAEEVLQTSVDNGDSDDHSHQWLDENGWKFRKAYVQTKDGTLYSVNLNIALAKDGRNIFYDVNDIKEIGVGNVPSSPGHDAGRSRRATTTDSGKRISQSSKDVNTSGHFMVRETNERYLSAVRAGDMDAARSMVDEAADNALSKSAARGGDGKLLRLKHGTDAEFTAFDYTKHGGKNGAAEGIGIYLTDDPEVANKYGSRQLDLFADIRRPATSWKKTVTRGELARVIEAACRREAEQMVAEDEYGSVSEALKDTWISNFVYTYDYGNIRDAYRATADIILQSNDNDMDIVNELLVDQGIRDNQQTFDFYHDILTPITGIDGLWTKWKQGDGTESNIILAFDPSQVKSAEPVTYDDNDNVIPISERFNRGRDEYRYMVREDGTEAERSERAGIEATPPALRATSPFRGGVSGMNTDRAAAEAAVKYRFTRRYRDAVKAFGYEMSGDELLLDDPAGEYEALARMPEPEYAVFRERDGYVRDAIRRISEAKKPDPKDIMTVAKYYTVGDKVSGALSQKEAAAMLTAFYDYAANAGASTDAGDFGTSLMELAYKLASRIVDGQLKYYPINPVWADDAAVVEDARTVVNKYLNQGRIYDRDAEGQALGARQSRTGVKNGGEYTRIGMDELYSVVETERWRNAFKDNYNNPAEVLDEMIDVVAEAEPTYANYYDVFDGQEWTDCQPDAVVKVTEQLLNDALVIDAYARQRADYGMVPAADLDQARDEFDEKVKEVRREADRQIKEALKQNEDLRKSREEWENVYREDFNREREKLSSAARENQKLRRSREGIMATSQKRRRELTATRRELKRETARADRAERNVERQKAKTEKAELEARRRLEDEREKRRRQRGEFNDALKQQRADLKHEAANAVHNALMRERQKVVAQRAKQQTLQAVVKLRKAVSSSRYEMPEGINRLAELTLGLFDDNALVMPADLQRTAVAVMEAVDELNLPEDGDVYGELVTSIVTATENMQSAPALYEYAALAPDAADEAGRTNAEKYEAAVHDMVVATERIVKRFNAEAAYMKKITAEVSKDIDARKYGERSKVRQSLDRAAAMAESAFRRAVMEEPYVARRIGGTFGKLMDDFRRTGENKYWTYVFGAQERLSALIDKYNARDLIKGKSKDVFTFRTHTGQKLALRADQAMGVYAVWLRERANVDEQGRPRTAHLAAGGIVFTNGEMADGTKVPLSTGKFQLNDADVRKIKEFLDKDGRKLTKLTQEIVKYMTDEVGEWGNKASLAMYGVKKFEDRSYYPFETQENGLVTQSKTDVSGEMGGQKKGIAAFGGGMTKEVTRDAMNPIKVNNFFDVVAGHINAVAAYGAYAEGRQNLLWIMNYRTAAADGVPGTMFREYLDDAYGKGTAAWVSKWLSDLAGGQEKDNTFGAILFSRSKGAMVAANLSVTLKQPTSIGRAMAYLGLKHFIGNPFSAAGVRTERSAYKEALKWSGAAKSKLAGGSFDLNDGRSAAEFMLLQPGKRVNNLQDLTGLGARLADEVTWGNIWNACKRWTRKNMPALTGDEFMKATAQKFDEVVQLTQDRTVVVHGVRHLVLKELYRLPSGRTQNDH